MAIPYIPGRSTFMGEIPAGITPFEQLNPQQISNLQSYGNIAGAGSTMTGSGGMTSTSTGTPSYTAPTYPKEVFDYAKAMLQSGKMGAQNVFQKMAQLGTSMGNATGSYMEALRQKSKGMMDAMSTYGQFLASLYGKQGDWQSDYQKMMMDAQIKQQQITNQQQAQGGYNIRLGGGAGAKTVGPGPRAYISPPTIIGGPATNPPLGGDSYPPPTGGGKTIYRQDPTEDFYPSPPVNSYTYL